MALTILLRFRAMAARRHSSVAARMPSFYICEYTNAGELNVKLYEYPAFFRGHQRVGTPEYLTMMRLRKIWAEGSFSVLKREHCILRIRKRGILAATEECLLAAMALNLKRMVSAIFRYLQIYCSAGTTVGFSRIFAFVNRSNKLRKLKKAYKEDIACRLW